MTTYAKLNDNGTLDILRRVPHVSNPTPETMAAYAAAHGYKPVVYTEAPASASRAGWQDTGTGIVQVWTALPHDEAREQAMQQVQQWRNNAMQTSCVLKTPYGWPLEYTQEAVSLAQGTLMLMLTDLCTSTSWTDADNTRHEGLEIFDMKVIAALLADHIRRIQDKADALRARISTATAEELPGILQELG